MKTRYDEGQLAPEMDVTPGTRPRGRPQGSAKPDRDHLVHMRCLAERASEATAAAWFGVPGPAIRARSRSKAGIARARQAGIYLAHIVFSTSLTRAGLIFGRDRTTARHACAVIEELREARAFDAAIDRLEPSLRVWVAAFSEGGRASAATRTGPVEPKEEAAS